MRTLALIALLAVLPAVPAAAAAERRAPNVLLVMTDDQAAGGGTMEVMPATRRFVARAGTTFTEAHATTPKCCPSRATFFSGLYAHNHKVTSNNVPGRLDQRKTVQRHLRRKGYRTAIFGKFLNGWPMKIDPDHWDEWSITNGGFYGATWNENGRVRRIGTYSTDLIARRAVGFLRRANREDDDQPWLAWLTPSAPHLPATPARRHRDVPLPPFPLTPALLEDDWADKPDLLDRARGFFELIDTARHDGRRSLMSVDEMVARLRDELRRMRELRDTIVIFTSDNGMLLGEHGALVGKDLPYRASTQIPLMVRWPGRLEPGSKRRDFVTNADVATTILRAARVDVRTDGRSLLSKRRRGRLYSESFGARNIRGTLVLPPWRTIRTKRWRYAEYRQLSGDLIAREYYDLRRDPWELRNVAGTLSERRVAALSAELSRVARCKGRSCP